MSKLKATTDFFIWLLFIVTILATVTLITVATYYMTVEPHWNYLLLYLSAIITLAMHYGVRQMPAQ